MRNEIKNAAQSDGNVEAFPARKRTGKKSDRSPIYKFVRTPFIANTVNYVMSHKKLIG